ncbi:MAG TPA: hypothetical protein VI818_07255, partial [Candidatus Thermoplasmatota archaeon]|nr:hypothetical protein [Candidatus Thermoplasmatota archaeon]
STDETDLSSTQSLSFVASEGGPAETVFFFDDGDAAATWTFTRQIRSVTGGATVTQNHPLSQGWHVTGKDKFSGAKAWTFQTESSGGYHDAEYDIMTSADIDLTATNSAFLSFVYRGDTEAGSGEDFRWEVSVAGGAFTKMGGTDAIVKDWTTVVYDLSKHAGKKIKIRFLFESDELCSSDTDAPEGCGDHVDYKGYFVDDIKVSSVETILPEE